MATKLNAQELVQGIDVLAKNFADLNKQLELVVGNILQTQKAFDKQSKSQADVANKTNEVQKNNAKLQDIEKQRIKLINDINKANSTAIDKNEQLKLQLQHQRKVNKEFAKEKLALIGAYEKESNRLVLLKKQYKDLAIQGKDNTEKAKLLKSEIVSLSSNLKKTDASVNDLLKSQKRSEKVTLETVRATEELRRKKKALTDQVRKESGEFKKNTSFTNKLSGAFKLAAAQITAALAALSGLIRIAKESIKITLNYEKANAELAGILGVSRNETIALQKSSAQLGATTAKSASEVVKLQQAYARLGFTQSEIISLTEGTIDGSIALNSELDATAELTGAVVNSFDNFSATDAGKILDTLTLSTQKSATNFEFLSTALPTAAGAANGAGVAFETLVDQLGQAADRGINASTAATSIRNIYLALADEGLTLDEAFRKINSSQDKLTAANDLFGERAAVTALALASNADEATKFNKALENVSGTAARVAAEQLDTLSGDLTLLSSAWEGLNLTVTKTGGLRKVVQGLTNFVSLLTESIQKARSEGSLFFAVLTGLAQSIKLSYAGISTFFEISVINPLKGAVKAMNALAKKDLQGAKDAIKNIFIEGKNDVIDFKDSVVDSGIKIRNAYIGLNEEIQDLNKETTDKAKEELDEQVKNVENSEAKKTRTVKQAVDERRRLEQEKAALDSLGGGGDVDLGLDDFEKQLDKENEIEFLNAKNQAERLLGLKQEQYDKELEDFLENERLKKEQYDKELEDFLENERLKKEIQDATADAGAQILSDQYGAFIDNNLNEFQASQEAQEQSLKNRLDKGFIDEKEYEKELKKLRLKGKQEEAKAEKKKALFDVAVNTASAIVKALPNIPLSITAGILGAIQAGVIAAKPIPKFRFGGDHKGGVAEFSEKGNELFIPLGGGNPVLTPDKRTVGWMPPGEFFSHDSPETQAYLQGGISSEQFDKLINEQKETRKAILNQPKQPIITEKGIITSSKLSNQRTTHLNKYLRGERI